jgi:hypothetical protein
MERYGHLISTPYSGGPRFSFGQQTYYVTDDFRGLSQSIQANSAIISQSKPEDKVFSRRSSSHIGRFQGNVLN